MVSLIVALAVSTAFTDPETSAPAPTPEPERKICRTEQETYSRLAAKRICRTAAEWKTIDSGVSSNVDTRRRERGIR
jgi:hypothetical protein